MVAVVSYCLLDGCRNFLETCGWLLFLHGGFWMAVVLSIAFWMVPIFLGTCFFLARS